MTIEWRQRPSGLLVVECGDLTLIAFEGRGDLHFRAIVEIESQPLLDGFDYDTLDAAKLAAETFAREWVARQARALGDGWIPVAERLPEDFDAVVILAKECDGYVYRGLASYDAQYGKWIVNGGSGHGLTVSHWLALPPLPVVEVEE